MPVLPIRNHGDAIVHGIQLSLFAQPPCASIGWILAHRQANPLAVLAPLKVISTFGVSFLLTADDDQIGLDAAICRQNDRAVAQPLAGLDAFGEVYLFALRVRHR